MKAFLFRLLGIWGAVLLIGCSQSQDVGVLPKEGTKEVQVKYETPSPPVDVNFDLGRLERPSNGVYQIKKDIAVATGRQLSFTGEVLSDTKNPFGVVIIECYHDAANPLGKQVRRLTSTVHVVCQNKDGKATFDASLAAPTQRGKHELVVKGLRMTAEGPAEEVQIATGEITVRE